MFKVKGIEKDNKPFNFCDTTYIIDNNNCNVSKLRRCNSLKEENEERGRKVEPKKVGYEVSLGGWNFFLAEVENFFTLVLTLVLDL